MEIAFEGWRYINALFQGLWAPYNEYNKGRLVSPRFVFRGVTQRHFTSSEVIRKYLLDNQDVLNYYIEKLESKKAKNPQKYSESSKLNWKTIIEWCYNDDCRTIREGIKELTQRYPDNPEQIINEITRGRYADVFLRVKPQFIRSGAAVRLYNQRNRTQNDYVCYLRNLILEMKSRYPVQYSNYSDLELLADIQHKGGASCLVDFSTNFLVSLWFATQDYESKENEMGYVFCYDVNADAIEQDNLTILNQNKERKSIEQLIFETTKSTKFNGIDSYKFWLWKPSSINSRISRQDSIFVFGIEKFKLSEHPVIVLPIPHKWKKPIQHVLKDFFGIYGETIYADASGLAATNTKKDPMRTQTQYFNESAIYDNDAYNGRFRSFELFQKGMSALLKSQYGIALDFFSAFEGTNAIKLCSSENVSSGKLSNYNFQMLIVELQYSKGMCLRHMGNNNEAIVHYRKALKSNLNLLAHCGVDFTRFNMDSNELQDKETLLKRYASNKLFKILEDYIGLLYDTRHYFDAYSELKDIVKVLDQDGLSIPPEMSLLINTACNEIKTLAILYKNPRFDKIDIELCNDKPSSLTVSPFCDVLNCYFKAIEAVAKETIDAYHIETSDEVEALVLAAKKAIESQSLPTKGVDCKYVFTAWDLKDLKDGIQQLRRVPHLQKALLYLTSIVEDCQRQIDGRKRPEIY